MSRYIDADVLIKHIKTMPWKDTPEAEISKFIFLSTVEEAPTADVEEVRHGYWTGMDGDQCSNCGKSLRDLMDGDSYYSSEFEYGGFDALVACPFCGAKMDGQRRTDDEE